MIVEIEKPFSGRAELARTYVSTMVRTPNGVGRVQEAIVSPGRGIVTLKVWVEQKKVKHEKTQADG